MIPDGWSANPVEIQMSNERIGIENSV